MKILNIKDIVDITNGKLFCGDESTLCSSFSKDTRNISEGDVYIGIKGETFDGNLFYKDAFSKGACAAILESDSFKRLEDYDYDKPIVLVSNTLDALKKLGTYIRDNHDILFVGVTGSVGKTSTRDMIHSVLSEEYNTLKTNGNYNNNIGVPLTLLRLRNESAAVIEMGMNNLGEIDYLSRIVKPNISVITNVGTAHIGNLGSRENILKAKLEIINGMDENGILVINNDNDLLHEYYLNNKKNIKTIGINNDSDVRAKDIKLFETHSEFKIIYDGNAYDAICNVPGEVFVINSLIAFMVGILANISPEKILKGISNFELTKKRMDIVKLKNNITLIDDAYNANADSMKSSLNVLKNMSSDKKIAVLGSMLELGTFSKELHEEVGETLYNNGIDVLITVGEDAKYIANKAKVLGKHDNIYSYDNNTDACKKIDELIERDTVILLKASNGLHFVEIADYLKKNYS